MRVTGLYGWLLLLVYVIAWDVLAPQTLSDAFYESLRNPWRGWLVITVWLVITLHLFKLVPMDYDPIHIVWRLLHGYYWK